MLIGREFSAISTQPVRIIQGSCKQYVVRCFFYRLLNNEYVIRCEDRSKVRTAVARTW